VSARILVIEDTPANLDLMTYLLESFGHTVQSAKDGGEGLECARRDPPDLIVCDIHVPGMDGYEVARQLKADPVLRRIPIVAVTALAMIGDREKVVAAGFDGYLSKPIEPEQFVAEMEVFLDPALHSTPRAAPAPSTETPAGAPKKPHALLLAVDDSEIELQLLHSVFDPSGYEVRPAKNLTEALHLARTLHPDLIVCDVIMPGGTGFDLLAAVKADPELCDEAVVLITSASLTSADQARAVAAGALRFIARPIEPEALLAVIEECLLEIEEN